MTANETHLVKYSWSVVERIDPVVAGGIFYKRLFESAPYLKPMFSESIPVQSKKLMAMIGYVINRLDKLDTILEDVKQLAKRRVKYGVQEEHYEIVGSALLWTLAQALANLFTDEVKQAWANCYNLLASAMLEATAEAPERA
ncbi:globin domain-containing protein [Lacibacter sp. H407]|uniref:globin domain-containing protein n=1 Tax=Lacibacter sp. H407 TaxID=3133423 RepID=UPI0030BE8794